MKLVIDIPDEMHKQIMDGYVPLGIGKYLKNGKPYTKHNAKAFKECKRLSRAIDDIKAEIKERLWEDDAERVCEIINKHIGERSE